MLGKVWNYQIKGIPMAITIIARVLFLKIYEKINTFFWKINLGKADKGVFIQKGVVFRYVRNIKLDKNVKIGRNCQLNTEIHTSQLLIKQNTSINKNCVIDFSGGILIDENVTISEGVMIESHDHGYDPRSKPVGIKKVIEKDVWIGTKAIILPQARIIGKGSIVAAGAVVTKDVQPFTIVGGNPAKILKHKITN